MRQKIGEELEARYLNDFDIQAEYYNAVDFAYKNNDDETVSYAIDIINEDFKCSMMTYIFDALDAAEDENKHIIKFIDDIEAICEVLEIDEDDVLTLSDEYRKSILRAIECIDGV